MPRATSTPDPFAGPFTVYGRDPWTAILCRALDARIEAERAAGTRPPAPPTAPFPEDDAEERAA
jgi:hypothetical protein